MIHIRMILKHLCFSGMLGIMQSKINNEDIFCYPCYVLSLISPNFGLKSIIFPNFGHGPSPKIAEKSPGK